MGCLNVLVSLLYVTIWALAAKRNARVSRVEQRLIDMLLVNISKYARPVTRNDLPVVVDFQVQLEKLGDLNIKDQVMVGNYRILMRWHNPHLVWKKTDYNGTGYINLPSNLIWTPDIMLQNTASKQSQAAADIYKSQIIIKNTGVAIWMCSVELEASCSMDVRWFPFDTQDCILEFGSRSYTKNKLNLRFFRKIPSDTAIKGKKHYSSGHWTMIRMRAAIVEEYFECCDEPFTVIKYKFKWKRLTMYWLLYLVFPCLFLSFLAIFTFLIPVDTGERTGFGITAVLAMSVYLLVISDKLPEKSDESPVIGVLYTVLFFLTSGALLSVIITTHLAFKTTEPPAFLRKYLRLKKNKGVRPGSCEDEVKEKAASDLDIKDIEDRNSEERTIARDATADHVSGSNFQEEWKEISQKVDQYLFRIFLMLTVMALLIVLLSYQT